MDLRLYVFCAQGDDFDFHEVFADYFVNEFDDPLNAYVGGMANYNSHLSAIPMTYDGSSDPNAKKPDFGSAPVSLPTGGIRTAFHQATAPSESEMGTSAKKARTDDDTSGLTPSQVVSDATLMQQQGIDGQQQQQSSTPAQVTLPVGVGIRFGNIAPAVGQKQVMMQVPGMQFNQTQDGNNTPMVWSIFNQHQSGGHTEVATAERRERNREHAKRSRIRKKFILESLQAQVRQLQRENASLRLIVQENITEHSMQIFEDCCSKNPLFVSLEEDNEAFDVFGRAVDGSSEEPMLVRSDFSLMSCLTSGQKCFVLSDPKLPDNPIVYATGAFYEMTGYTPKEVLGRNCRFLQGPGTDRRSVDVLRKAVETGSDLTICLLNYKADGTPFWNQLFIAALRDADNCIVNYVSLFSNSPPSY
jgi:PAS domain S-box-containing protein